MRQFREETTVIESYKPNKKSWHYRVVKRASGGNMPLDFCQYWRTIFLIVIFTGSIGTFLSYVVVGWFYGLYLLLFNFKLFEDGNWWYFGFLLGSMFIYVSLLSSLLIWLLVKGYEKIFEKRRRNYVAKPPGLINTKYRSIKYKFCPRVDYSEVKNYDNC